MQVHSSGCPRRPHRRRPPPQLPDLQLAAVEKAKNRFQVRADALKIPATVGTWVVTTKDPPPTRMPSDFRSRNEADVENLHEQLLGRADLFGKPGLEVPASLPSTTDIIVGASDASRPGSEAAGSSMWGAEPSEAAQLVEAGQQPQEFRPSGIDVPEGLVSGSANCGVIRSRAAFAAMTRSRTSGV